MSRGRGLTPEVLAAYDRPRERLAALGPEALSTRELMALVIGSGSAAAPVHEVADRVLVTSRGSLSRLAQIPLAGLERVPGVGVATASRIVAALELGRRAQSEELPPGTRIRGPGDVHALMGPRLRGKLQEEFHVLLLDTRHRVTRDVAVTRGTLDASLVHPREVFRAAIVEGASGVVLVHNHPSGDPTPSAEDRSITVQLREAGRAVGIPVLDHVIIGHGAFHSLADEGDFQV